MTFVHDVLVWCLCSFREERPKRAPECERIACQGIPLRGEIGECAPKRRSAETRSDMASGNSLIRRSFGCRLRTTVARRPVEPGLCYKSRGQASYRGKRCVPFASR